MKHKVARASSCDSSQRVCVRLGQSPAHSPVTAETGRNRPKPAPNTLTQNGRDNRYSCLAHHSTLELNSVSKSQLLLNKDLFTKQTKRRREHTNTKHLPLGQGHTTVMVP